MIEKLLRRRVNFIMAGLSSTGVNVFLYPVEGGEPVGTLMDGTTVYYKE